MAAAAGVPTAPADEIHEGNPPRDKVAAHEMAEGGFGSTGVYSGRSRPEFWILGGLALLAAEAPCSADNGDEWVLNGSKTFTTNGSVADVAIAIAVTDKWKGAHGISAFLVPRGTPGFRNGKKEDKLGHRASDTSEMVFDNCRVPQRLLLGDEGAR